MQEEGQHQCTEIDQDTIKEIRQVLPDSKVHQLLVKQLQMLPKNTFQVYVAFQKIYIIISCKKYIEFMGLKQQLQTKQLNLNSIDLNSKFAIKISKSYPLKNSLKLHLLDGNFIPKISDNRDLFEELMGKPFHYSIHLLDIFDKIIYFNKTLRQFNQNYLDMQKLGKFNLGEKYYYQQLTELYSSICLFKDLNNKKYGIYVGLTQTHLLLFQQLQTSGALKKRASSQQRRTDSTSNQKQTIELQKREQTFNQLQLVCYAEMQCIDTIYYKQNQKYVKINYKKYQSIKLYHQFQEIKRQYRFYKPQLFIRGILKSITKFQHCDIKFQPYRTNPKKEKDKKPSINDNMVKHRQNQRINFYIDEANKHQLELKKEKNEHQRKKHLQQIQKYYTKLIQFYSARANPYYLIYVNKLNNLYEKCFLRDHCQRDVNEQEEPRDS